MSKTFAKNLRKANSGRTLNMEVNNKLAEIGCDPILGMAHIAMADYQALGLLEKVLTDEGVKVERVQQIPIELRAAMYRELAQYVAPKRRPVDMDGEAGSEIHINVLSFSDTDAGKIEG